MAPLGVPSGTPTAAVVIRRSSSQEVVQLVAALAGAAAAREAAIARLRVIGTRAVPHLLHAWGAAEGSEVRTAVLQALEGSDDPRVATIVLGGLQDEHADVRAASAAAARGLLEGEHSDEVLDRLTALAVATSQPTPVRVAAIIALQDLSPVVVAPVLRRLAEDEDPGVRAAAYREPTGDDTPDALLHDAATGELPADPQLLVQALVTAAAAMPLPILHRLVQVLRRREDATSDAARRREWATARGAVHHALASRGSRVAVYDVRDTVRGAAAPLPEGFLSALAAVGDAEALDDLAAAYDRMPGPPADTWGAELRATARAIVRRERLSARHAAVKRLHTRWGETAAALLG